MNIEDMVDLIEQLWQLDKGAGKDMSEKYPSEFINLLPATEFSREIKTLILL